MNWWVWIPCRASSIVTVLELCELLALLLLLLLLDTTTLGMISSSSSPGMKELASGDVALWATMPSELVEADALAARV